MEVPNKRVLDVCCGSRMFWFDKKHPDALYLDNRTLPPTLQTNGATITVAPDVVPQIAKRALLACGVRPPAHHKRGGKRSWMAEKYGELDRKTWPEDIRAGFSECFRVLKPGGILIFKWNETDILLREVLALTPHRPLFGHPSGKASKTHWVAFMK